MYEHFGCLFQQRMFDSSHPCEMKRYVPEMLFEAKFFDKVHQIAYINISKLFLCHIKVFMFQNATKRAILGSNCLTFANCHFLWSFLAH